MHTILLFQPTFFFLLQKKRNICHLCTFNFKSQMTDYVIISIIPTCFVLLSTRSVLPGLTSLSVSRPWYRRVSKKKRNNWHLFTFKPQLTRSRRVHGLCTAADRGTHSATHNNRFFPALPATTTTTTTTAAEDDEPVMTEMTSIKAL